MSNNKKQSKHRDKKSVVLQTRKRGMNPLAIVLVAAVVVGAVGLGFFITQTTTSQMSNPSVAKAGATEITYPVSLFADGSARHFDYRADGMTVRYFILKSADGVLRAAFDACDVCWPAGKGYYQEGNYMVCRNCGRKFASELVNEVKGGCNPAPLNRQIKGDQLVIKVDDILTGKTYFNFKEKA